jgi:triosephosphate isomerase (TIM)
MIFVNFKTYKEASGTSSLHLAEACIFAQSKLGVKIIPIVQTVDIYKLNILGFEVFSQCIDPVEHGPFTGANTAFSISFAGAKGTLLNHSEKKLSFSNLEKAILFSKQESLKTLVCTDSLDEALKLQKLKPSFIAYEPPELIGGKISVSKAKPELIKDFAKKITKLPFLVGAGINSSEDVKKALELGAKGVLVSSNVVLAQDPKKALLNLAEGF